MPATRLETMMLNVKELGPAPTGRPHDHSCVRSITHAHSFTPCRAAFAKSIIVRVGRRGGLERH